MAEIPAAGVIPSLLGAPVVGADAERLGEVDDLLVDDRTGRPAWVVVRLAGDGRTTAVPCAALRSRVRALQTTCTAWALAAVAGRAPEPLLARHFDVAPWDLPRLEDL